MILKIARDLANLWERVGCPVIFDSRGTTVTITITITVIQEAQLSLINCATHLYHIHFFSNTGLHDSEMVLNSGSVEHGSSSLESFQIVYNGM